MDWACQRLVERRVSKGIMAKGTETFTTGFGVCGRPITGPGEVCKMHQAVDRRVRAKLDAQRNGVK